MSVTHHSLAVEQGELALTLASNRGTGAAVVVVPSAFGVTPDLEAQMDELGDAASLVVALDPFFREDAGPANYEDMPRAMARLRSLDRERAHRDVRATIDYARTNGAGSVVLIGICFGGPFALLAAADGAVDGVVTWHGSRMEQYLARAAEMRCPMRLHCGSVDPVMPPEALQAVRAAFIGRNDVQIVVHEGATHGFSHRTAKVYDERAERAAMAAVRELVGEVG